MRAKKMVQTSYPPKALSSATRTLPINFVPFFFPFAYPATVLHNSPISSSDRILDRPYSKLKSHSSASVPAPSPLSDRSSRRILFLTFASNFPELRTSPDPAYWPEWDSIAVFTSRSTASTSFVSDPSTITGRAVAMRAGPTAPPSTMIPSAAIWTHTSLIWKASAAPSRPSMAMVTNPPKSSSLAASNAPHCRAAACTTSRPRTGTPCSCLASAASPFPWPS
mmetsp:Transcript_47882/g.93539  ORF Transcript_47882/g.93539 Transcript_47882/m.93539 type:complete len:223 (+) Transcript_47882:212-880(+)